MWERFPPLKELAYTVFFGEKRLICINFCYFGHDSFLYFLNISFLICRLIFECRGQRGLSSINALPCARRDDTAQCPSVGREDTAQRMSSCGQRGHGSVSSYGPSSVPYLGQRGHGAMPYLGQRGHGSMPYLGQRGHGSMS